MLLFCSNEVIMLRPLQIDFLFPSTLSHFLRAAGGKVIPLAIVAFCERKSDIVGDIDFILAPFCSPSW